MSFFDVKEFYPLLRRVFSSFSETAPVRSVAQWCYQSFEAERGLFHYVRIQRRLGHFAVRLQEKYRFKLPGETPNTTPGHYILRGFKKHRLP